MNQTNHFSTPIKTQTVLQHLYVLSNTYYEGMELAEICISAKYQPSSGHYIEISIVQKLDLVNSWTKHAAIAPQPRPIPYSNIYMFFLIHTMKGCNKKKYIYLPNINLVPAIT
jgi:hypothetical protein